MRALRLTGELVSPHPLHDASYVLPLWIVNNVVDAAGIEFMVSTFRGFPASHGPCKQIACRVSFTPTRRLARSVVRSPKFQD
jgi:hypothetical protein